MRGQRLNRYSRKGSNPTAYRSRRLATAKPIHDNQTGFIHHPSGFPLEFKKIWFDGLRRNHELENGEVGLIFESEKYIRPGCVLEITIPMRNEHVRFRGKVVLVKHSGECYEVGIWLRHGADASRARIVEQICHIETYTMERKFRDGPYCLDHDRIAQEWISEHAGTVPALRTQARLFK